MIIDPETGEVLEEGDEKEYDQTNYQTLQRQ